MEDIMDGKDILQKNSSGNKTVIDCSDFDFSLTKGDEFFLSEYTVYHDRVFAKGTKAVFSHYAKRNRAVFPPSEMFDDWEPYFAWFHIDGEERVRVLSKNEINKPA